MVLKKLERDSQLGPQVSQIWGLKKKKLFIYSFGCAGS